MLTAVLTAVLVAVTAYYAWQTYRMVEEMRRDRRERATPKVVVDLRSEGAGFAPPSVVNVGLGPALDVDVTITFVPRDGADLTGIGYVTRRWRARLVAPEERHRFVPPTDPAGQPLRLNRLAELFRSLRLQGTCRTSFGEAIVIDEELEGLRELWELSNASWHLVDEEPDKRIVDALKRIGKVLTKLVPRPGPEEQQRRLEASKAVYDDYMASPEGQAERAARIAPSGEPDDADDAEVADPSPGLGDDDSAE